jgi:hypothetical protein
MFDNAIYNSLKKRVDPYLEPGEDLLSVTMTEAAGMMRGYLVGGEVGLTVKGALRDHNRSEPETGDANESAVKLASANMTLAITSHRLLIFKFGKGRSANPKDLLADVPIGEVDSIDVGDVRVATRPVTIKVHGVPIELEVRRAVNTDLLINALAQAKSGTRPVTTREGDVATPNSATSDQPSAAAREGWQPDPTHRHELRYWNGQIWTAYVADQGMQSTDTVTTS